jgi:serine/threonine protein phosphatase PrpC
MSSNLVVAALSDMGCVRTNNEDNFGYDPANGFYVVCDGMGGMAAGEVASSIACSTAIHTFAAQPAETPAITRLSLAIRAANDAVRQASTQQGQHGMGTTLVSAVVQGSKLLVGNVGDSRAYLYQNSACMQLTVDHSYINELVRQGTVKVEDIHSVDLKGLESVITRAIGAANDVEPDFFAVDLKDGDTLLLASDGLTRYVDSGNLAALVDTLDLTASCQRLIDAAKGAGGADNITCLLLRYNTPEPTPAETPAETLSETPEAPAIEPPAEPFAETPAEPAAEIPTEPLPETLEETTEPTPAESEPQSIPSFDDLLDNQPEKLS